MASLAAFIFAPTSHYLSSVHLFFLGQMVPVDVLRPGLLLDERPEEAEAGRQANDLLTKLLSRVGVSVHSPGVTS